MAYRLQNYNFFTVDICPFVDDVGLEVTPGFLEDGLVPTHWWVKLGLGHLVGRAMIRDIT